MRIADVAKPGRTAWLATIALLAGQALVCSHAPRGRTARGPTTRIHIKLAAHGDVAGSRPELTHLPAGTSDSRERWRIVDVPTASVAADLAVLAHDPSVIEAFVAPEVSLASVEPAALADDSCPIKTPSFESYQGYLGPAPHGIDAPAAWRRGVRGQGVWFADVEGAWNATHEDLPGDRIMHAGGTVIPGPGWRMHGTAVLGEVVGSDNAKGVVGIAPDVDRVFTSSIGDTTVADAIDTAAEQLRAGDVLLIELQIVPRAGMPYLPVEFADDTYDVIRAASERGVIIIEAAGNGGANLDRFDKLRRATRDSGAIMVGAGAPPREGFSDRARLDFSNYGSRVDVQAWGRKVATLDYGDLQTCDGADRHYTGEFSGTSSASPIVAGAAVLLESYARTRGTTLSPLEVRSVLRATGTPQTGNVREPIGPRPDLARALAGAAMKMQTELSDLR